MTTLLGGRRLPFVPSPQGGPASGRSTSRGRTARAATVAGPALTLAVLGWHHRWIGDDGLIYTRVVRQLLAGHGPVFNVGERVETSTGTLWVWLVTAATYVTRQDPATVAVLLGLALAVGGLALALLGTVELYGRPARVVPLGVLVLLPVRALWDYATSGLETGLAFAWLGASWWTLVRAARHPSPGRPFTVAAVLLGLAPLVRPDLALVAVVYAPVLWLTVRPGPRRTLKAAAAGLALPLAYEIFRAGYYGILVPLPAVTKEASWTLWDRGLVYLADFTGPYHLWLPLTVLAAAAALLVRRLAPRGHRMLLVAAAPVVAGTATAVFVVKVGGDFMHGRMLLPSLFLVLLPLFAVPWSRVTGCALAALATWALSCAFLWRPAYHGGDGTYHVYDEHAGYVANTGLDHPVTQQAHAARRFLFAREVRDARASGTRTLLIETRYDRTVLKLPLAPRVPAAFVGVEARLGHAGTVIPLADRAVDSLSLANPLGAHTPPVLFSKAGHEKPVNPAWLVADYTAPAAGDSAAVLAARRALRCGAIAELQDSVRAPLTPARFWRNLIGAPARTSLRVPADPVRAEGAFCGRGPG
ncbi:hypothetical protein ACIREE_08375 [Streptomyces sp. NPDC102467]|uniref:hypothetical protein n=1 Tax=Streptomyces sp. NPDC102467 TaxID=3366179 RepID=UPI00382D920A